jgi:hypothetical protein
MDQDLAPDLREAQSIVDKLRADHDFFMRKFAHAVGILRELPRSLDSADGKARFTSVLDVVLEVERQLAKHNEIEENKIYPWASTIQW